MPLSPFEPHIHLYGCLTAYDLWEMGKNRWQDSHDGLGWYAAEFQRVFCRHPEFGRYWKGDGNFDLLRADYEMREAGNFAQFQAKFNLILALFRGRRADGEVLERVYPSFLKQGIGAADFRTLLPLGGSTDEHLAFLTEIAGVARRIAESNSGQFIPRWVINLPRSEPDFWGQYETIRAWQREHPDLCWTVVGVDFSHVEEGFPPKDKREFVAKLKAENSLHPLIVTYHVGESFTDKSLAQAARWVWEAADMGADRLGHALALGIDPEIYAGQTRSISCTEQKDHLRFLLLQTPILSRGGYPIQEKKWERELRELEKNGEDFIPMTYTDDVVADTRLFQNALLHDLSRKEVVIESCPTSNMRIGAFTRPEHHPLKRFLSFPKLGVCLSTDDPGIFATTLTEEENFCVRSLGVTREDLQRMASLAQSLAPVFRHPERSEGSPNGL